MSIKKVRSGKVLSETFSDSTLNQSLWSFWPSDPTKYSLTERPGYFRMHRDIHDTCLYLNEAIPDEFMFEIAYDYNPLNNKDNAGIVITSGLNQNAEFLAYYDSQGYKSDRLRVVKSNNYWNSYYRAVNGLWFYAGTLTIEQSVNLGIILKGYAGTGQDKFDVSQVSMCLGGGLRFTNMPNLWKITLSNNQSYYKEFISDGEGEIFASLLDTDIPFVGTLRVYNNAGTLVYTENNEFWPGDEYQQEIKLDIFIDDNQLDPVLAYYVGNFYDNQIIVSAVIKNQEPYPIENIRLKAKQILDRSWTWVEFAAYHEPSNSMSEFEKELIIPLIDPGEEYAIKIKIKRSSDFFTITPKDLSFMIEFDF